MSCMYRFSLWLQWLYVKVCACHALIKATYLLTYLLILACNNRVVFLGKLQVTLTRAANVAYWWLQNMQPKAERLFKNY